MELFQEKFSESNYRITVKNEALRVEKVISVEIKEGKEAVFADLELENKDK